MLVKQKAVSNARECFDKIIEFIIVMFLGFGLFIYSSTISFLEFKKSSSTQNYNSVDFIFIVVYEILILLIIAFYLKKRKWQVKEFNLDFTFSMIGIAMLLVCLREGMSYLIHHSIRAISGLSPSLSNEPNIILQTSLFSTIIMVIVNSIYEEFLLTGYLYKRFEDFHPAILILLSFIMRASFHTYQGLFNLIMVFILALIFGLYYLRYRKLWPIIIAHGIGNIFHFLDEHYHWLNY
ncbi:MAG TPA: type II CAAX endopeptidase family protein [Chitinophagaceae bacterium]|nr:type II CAAX endopeptidase family protein [Chitinophagaceae bacterium]